MKIKSVARLRVSLDLEGEIRHVGDLAWSSRERLAAFQYAPGFLQTGMNPSPFRLRRDASLQMAPRQPFEGLHGLFADSLPDGWGRLMVDQAIRADGGDPGAMTPLDRLAITGRTGMGALIFQPELPMTSDQGTSLDATDFDRLAKAAAFAQEGHITKDVDDLRRANGGSAGARPKIVILRDPDTHRMRLDTGTFLVPSPTPNAWAESWLVKFPARGDGPDAGRIEHAFACLAREVGIAFPQTRLFQGAEGEAYFGARRFDRTPRGRLHVHTAAGLLHADFRAPSIEYGDLFELTRRITGLAADVDQMCLRMIFNVVAGNRDDHGKNHAFLMDAAGAWRLSPAYDVTPSDGPGGEHSLAIAGEGRRPLLAHVQSAATRASISPRRLKNMLDALAVALPGWPAIAEQEGVPEGAAKRIGADLRRRASDLGIVAA